MPEESGVTDFNGCAIGGGAANSLFRYCGRAKIDNSNDAANTTANVMACRVEKYLDKRNLILIGSYPGNYVRCRTSPEKMMLTKSKHREGLLHSLLGAHCRLRLEKPIECFPTCGGSKAEHYESRKGIVVILGGRDICN